jgi:hypothetical protein
MSVSLLARAMLTALAAGQGLTPLFVDLNRTHATNPLWLGHARFHVVWQTFQLTLACIVEVALIWMPGPMASQCFYLAALLTSLPMLAFFIAKFSRKIYSGTLHDPNGIKPVPFRIGGKTFEIDMNAALVTVGALVLIAAVVLF